MSGLLPWAAAVIALMCNAIWNEVERDEKRN
jgi:hypothetical protein